MAKILIVDDRPANRELLITLLGYVGHRMLEAVDGEQGLAVARAERPDLIITDIVMPKMDGYEFARQVRVDPVIRETQIIFYTSSYIVNETRYLANACGVSIVIGKPIEPEIFLETIRVALENQELSSPLPVPDEFHQEHMRLLTDTLVKKVEDLELEIIGHERAKEALQQAKDFAEYLLETANVIFLQLDTSGNVQRINPAAEEITGYNQAEVQGKSWFETLVPRDRYPSVWEEFDQIRQQGKLVEIFENPIITKHGQERHILWKNNLLREGNEIIGTISFGIDITERKYAERALRESQEHYRQIIETAQEGIWTIDANNRTTLVNKRLAEMLGYTIEEMLGKSVYEFTDEEGKAIAAKSLENRRLGVDEQLDFKYIRKDGGVIWTIIEMSSLYDHEGNYTGALAMLTDITERKRAEEKIRQQLQYLTALSEIDRAISSSFDLQFSLTTVLLHVITQLGVDAADVLLFDTTLLTLEYAAGQGFHSQPLGKSAISLSKGHAARAVLNREPVYIPDLEKQPEDSLRSTLFVKEGFVSYCAIPLQAKGELNGLLEIFQRSHREPDKEWLDFLNTLAGQCAIAIDNATLFSGLQRSNIELALAYDATIEGWSRALDMRDKETEGHSRRVTDMSLRLARIMGMSEQEILQVRRGALLHDIGKMGVPDAILLKPGALTDDEWVVMKKHPGLAYEMLLPIAYLKPALDIPYCHHEKWDGTGYPRGLKGKQIPVAARIFAIVDVCDALLSNRPYRPAWPVEKVREHIRFSSGTHFDPQIVTVFLKSDILPHS